jgi:integrase
MWQRLIRGGRPLDEAGPGINWAAETKRVLKRDYGYWLSFVLNAYDGSACEYPTARVTVARVRAYCQSMEHVSAITRASRIARLYTIVRGANDALDLRWLADIRRRLEREARCQGPVRNKQARLRPSGQLVEVGLSLMKAGIGGQLKTPLVRAAQIRDGLMIALLASRPLRIKNFASLRLGHHMRETSIGFLIEIPGHECKTGQPIETFVPDELYPWLWEYLKVHRSVLLGNQTSDHVWLNNAGHAFQPGALSMRITAVTKRHVGVPISPHLFRDCAATTIATDDPEHVMTIAPLLGHTTLRTAEKHYNHARCLHAGRRYQDAVRQLRALARPLRRRTPKR